MVIKLNSLKLEESGIRKFIDQGERTSVRAGWALRFDYDDCH